jgi:periplasmic protein TonB
MLRGLPISIIVHLLALGWLATWGGQVLQPPLKPQRVLRVQIARMPTVEPEVSPVVTDPEPAPLRPAPEPPPTPEPTPQARPTPEPPPVTLPPKEVPRLEPRPEPKPEPTPPRPVAPPPQIQEQPPREVEPEPGPTLPASGPTVSGTDVDFPFAWYLNRVEGIIARNWNPRQLGFREGTSRTCVIHFMIDRAGQTSQVTLVNSSGVSLFDREALRAVKSGRLPPLPPKFPHRALGVTFVFTLESGI